MVSGGEFQRVPENAKGFKMSERGHTEEPDTGELGSPKPIPKKPREIREQRMIGKLRGEIGRINDDTYVLGKGAMLSGDRDMIKEFERDQRMKDYALEEIQKLQGRPSAPKEQKNDMPAAITPKANNIAKPKRAAFLTALFNIFR